MGEPQHLHAGQLNNELKPAARLPEICVYMVDRKNKLENLYTGTVPKFALEVKFFNTSKIHRFQDALRGTPVN